MTKVDSALVRLLGELFQPPELKQLLEREDWAASWLLDIPPPERMAANEWFHDLVRAVDQRNLRPKLRELLLREREHQQAEIDRVLAAMSAAPPAVLSPAGVPPAVAPYVLPQPRARLLRVGLVLTAAVTVLAFLALNYPTADDLTAPSTTPTRVPQGDLLLTLVYLDPPQAGVSRSADWFTALEAVLAAGPRAVVLHGHRRPTEDNTALRDLLRAHPDLPILGLSPRAEGSEPVDPDQQPLVPACPEGPREGCAWMILPSPQITVEDSVYTLSPCLGTMPTLALALARLAQSPTALDLLIESCWLGEQVEALAIPSAPCRLPYRWLWMSELTSGVKGAPRVPKRSRGEEVCVGWLDLADRVVVLDDPWANPDEPRVPTDGGEPLPLPPAEALAVSAWTTLGVLEAR